MESFKTASYALVKTPDGKKCLVFELLSNGHKRDIRIRGHVNDSPDLVAMLIGVAFETTRQEKHLIQAFPEILDTPEATAIIDEAVAGYRSIPKKDYSPQELNRIRAEISQHFQDPQLN